MNPELANRSVRLLLVTGSTRRASTNTAALHVARTLLGEDSAVVYDGLAGLPAFNPDDDYAPLPPAVADLRSAIAAADAVVFCTPEYAGTLPGSFKNLLDWTVGGSEIHKPVTWINVAGPGRGGGADSTLTTVLGYVGGRVLESSGIRVPVAHQAVGPDGLISDEETRGRLAQALATIVADVREALS
jgi:chromate reductase, NAD(P)H dehydrogenase (quinone)